MSQTTDLCVMIDIHVWISKGQDLAYLVKAPKVYTHICFQMEKNMIDIIILVKLAGPQGWGECNFLLLFA